MLKSNNTERSVFFLLTFLAFLAFYTKANIMDNLTV